jgi:DNA-binding FrmR family transcriptional regulator
MAKKREPPGVRSAMNGLMAELLEEHIRRRSVDQLEDEPDASDFC